LEFYKRRVNRILLPFILISLPFFIYLLSFGKISLLQFAGYVSTLSFSLIESCKLNNINPYEYWADLIDFIGCEGIDLNSFVHSQWHKHTKVV